MSRRTRPIASHGELLALTQGDPYVRWGVPDPLPGTCLQLGDAVAVERRGRRHGFVVWPRPGAADPTTSVGDLLTALGAEGHLRRTGVRSLSVPQAYGALLADRYRVGPGGDWDWMWTTTAPPVRPHEHRLVELDDTADAQEIDRFSRLHSPRGEGQAGIGRAVLWLGLRDPDGALAAVGAMERLPSGIPHLAGIVTAGQRRGEGLGATVTAGLTRAALDANPACTLGVYSDNPAARALYGRLGYRTAHAWCSRAIVADASAS